MKITLPLFLCLFLLLEPVTAQDNWAYGQDSWQMIYNSPDYESKIETIGWDTIFAVGHSHLHKSYDGGLTWSTFQPFSSGSWMTDIDFSSPLVGYFCGGSAFKETHAFVYKTVDGGMTWNPVFTTPNGPHYSATQIEFVTDEIGFIALDGNGGLYKTLDGGQEYLKVLVNLNITDIVFPTPEIGYVSSQETIEMEGHQINKIFKSIDQGHSWELVYADTIWNVNTERSRAIAEMDFVNEKVGYAVGANNLFIKTLDGGLTWQEIDLGTNNYNLTSLDFVTEEVGFVNFEGKVFKILDGGLSFMEQDLVPSPKVSHIKMINENAGYLIGSLGVNSIYKFNQQPVKISYGLDEIVIYPNPDEPVLIVELDESITLEGIELFDIKGKLVRSFDGNNRTLNIKGLSVGHYFVRILSEDKEVTKKVILD